MWWCPVLAVPSLTLSRGPAILYLGTIAVALIGMFTVIGTGMCVATWSRWRGLRLRPEAGTEAATALARAATAGRLLAVDGPVLGNLPPAGLGRDRYCYRRQVGTGSHRVRDRACLRGRRLRPAGW